jgi:predicted SnoaL-like aldol condensation-catalyzing enzyme
MPPRNAIGRTATSSTARTSRPAATVFNLIRTLPDALKYENRLIVAEGDYVIAHGRFSGTGRPAAWVAADIVRIEGGKLAEHWDVLQDEATKAQSVSGLPMFGDRFPD